MSKWSRYMKAIIIGSGIAGSATRLALKRIGISVRVYEKAKAFTAIGAGLTLAPNGLSVIDSLGLYDKIKAISQEEKAAHAYDDSGKKLSTLDFTFNEKEHGYPLLGMTRHDLQTVLMESAAPVRMSMAKGKDVFFGKKCVAVEQPFPDGPAKVFFEDGTVDEADLVVGADGARSVLSSYVTGQPQELLQRYSGFISTFGLTKAESYPEAATGDVTWVYGQGKTWGGWCLPDGRLFWFTVNKSCNPSTAVWSTKLLDSVRTEFGECWYHEPRGFSKVLDATDRATTIALTDKAGHKMTKGKVVLVGDAAHAVTPWAGQGGNLALEDAAVLATFLYDAKGDVSNALVRFDKERVPRSNNVAKFSKLTGALQTSNAWWGPLARRVAFSAPAWILSLQVSWLYKYQPRCPPSLV